MGQHDTGSDAEVLVCGLLVLKQWVRNLETAAQWQKTYPFL